MNHTLSFGANMRRASRLAVMLCGALGACSAVAAEPPAQDEAVKNLALPPSNWLDAYEKAQIRLRMMDARLRALEARQNQADHAVDRLDAANQERAQNDHSSAMLKLGEQGYSTLDTDVGRITVEIRAVRAVGNGTRLTIQFGNPTAANLSSLKARIQWGGHDDLSGDPPAGGKTVLFHPATGVPASSWRAFDVDLPGVAPARVEWIKLYDLVVESISLSKSALDK